MNAQKKRLVCSFFLNNLKNETKLQNSVFLGKTRGENGIFIRRFWKDSKLQEWLQN